MKISKRFDSASVEARKKEQRCRPTAGGSNSEHALFLDTAHSLRFKARFSTIDFLVF
jgi:hypothetical protein